jgi:uncharacterized protein YyaL (SSP411 family)
VRLSALSGREDLREVAEAVLSTWGRAVEQLPVQFPTLLRAAALLEAGPGLGLVVGEPEDPRTVALAARARDLLASDEAVIIVRPGSRPAWLDPAWLQGREALGDQSTAYLCRGEACSLPATEPSELALPPGSGAPPSRS